MKFSMVAAGLAGHANTTQSSDLMGLARRQYAIALQKINTALRSPTEAVKDRTLYAYFRISFPSIECLRRHIQSSFLLKCPSSSSKFIFPNQVMLTRAQTVHNSGRYIRINGWGKTVYVPRLPSPRRDCFLIILFSLLHRECPRLTFI